MSRLLILLSIFTCCVFAGVDLPRLNNPNITLPALAISYPPPTNPAVKALTEQKNGQLFQVGMNAIYFSIGIVVFSWFNEPLIKSIGLDWNALETSPGAINIAPLTDVVKVINGFLPVLPLVSCSYLITLE